MQCKSFNQKKRILSHTPTTHMTYTNTSIKIFPLQINKIFLHEFYVNSLPILTINRVDFQIHFITILATILTESLQHTKITQLN